LVVNGPAVTDVAGNPLSTTTLVASSFTIFHSTVQWINPLGGDWNNPSNWSTGVLPGPNDDVLIDVPGGVTITHLNGDAQAHSLLSTNPFAMYGGTFTVTNGIQVNNAFTFVNGVLNNGGTLMVPDGAVLQLVNGALQGGTLATSGTGLITTIFGNGFGTQLVNVTNNGQLDVVDHSALQLLGTITNNGTISLLAGQNGFFADLWIDGAVTLAGTGQVQLSNSANNRILGQNTAFSQLTNQSTIAGTGQIGVGPSSLFTLINQGTVLASGGDLWLGPTEQIRIGATETDTMTVTNTGTLSAGTGGALRLVNSIVTNTGGLMEAKTGGVLVFGAAGADLATFTGGTVKADAGGAAAVLTATFNGVDWQTLNGGVVQLQQAMVQGGTFTTSGTGVVTTASGNGFGPQLKDVTNNGQIQIVDHSALQLLGTITNNGTISLLAQNNFADLWIDGGVTLTGTGRVQLSNNLKSRILGQNTATSQLTNQSTIAGTGQIGVGPSSLFTLINQGTVLASGGDLWLGPTEQIRIGATETDTMTVTNTGTLSAGTGGALRLVNSIVTNTGGLIEAQGGVVVLGAAGEGLGTVTGGTISIDASATAGLVSGAYTGITWEGAGSLQLGGGDIEGGTLAVAVVTTVQGNGIGTGLRNLAFEGIIQVVSNSGLTLKGGTTGGQIELLETANDGTTAAVYIYGQGLDVGNIFEGTQNANNVIVAAPNAYGVDPNTGVIIYQIGIDTVTGTPVNLLPPRNSDGTISLDGPVFYHG
jgi:hypothetical protein